MGKVTVNEWKEMFKAIGLDEAAMLKWHKVFEAKNSAGHESFLQWLGLSKEDIKKVRTAAK